MGDPLAAAAAAHSMGGRAHGRLHDHEPGAGMLRHSAGLQGGLKAKPADGTDQLPVSVAAKSAVAEGPAAGQQQQQQQQPDAQANQLMPAIDAQEQPSSSLQEPEQLQEHAAHAQQHPLRLVPLGCHLASHRSMPILASMERPGGWIGGEGGKKAGGTPCSAKGLQVCVNVGNRSGGFPPQLEPPLRSKSPAAVQQAGRHDGTVTSLRGSRAAPHPSCPGSAVGQLAKQVREEGGGASNASRVVCPAPHLISRCSYPPRSA